MFILKLATGRQFPMRQCTITGALRVAFALAKRHACAVDVLDENRDLITTASIGVHGHQLKDAA